MLHHGRCRCGAVEIEVEAPEQVTCEECNCSICGKSGYLHLIVPRSRFRLLKGEESLTTYTFNTGAARHRFCRVCGIKTFHVPRSNPDGYDVSVRCLEPPPRGLLTLPLSHRHRPSPPAPVGRNGLALPASTTRRPGRYVLQQTPGKC